MLPAFLFTSTYQLDELSSPSPTQQVIIQMCLLGCIINRMWICSGLIWMKVVIVGFFIHLSCKCFGKRRTVFELPVTKANCLSHLSTSALKQSLLLAIYVNPIYIYNLLLSILTIFPLLLASAGYIFQPCEYLSNTFSYFTFLTISKSMDYRMA